MLRLAVATQEETFERMRDPLADRGIEVVPLQAKERAIGLTDASPDVPDVDVGFVFPTRLMEGGALDALLGVPWVNDREAVVTSRNKGGVVAALARAGIAVPETVMLSNPVSEAEVSAAVSGMAYPLVVKPNSATRGVGVTKVDDEDSLLGVVDYLDLVHDYRATGDKSYLIQEFLPDARDYRAMVVDGDCYGGVERRLPDPAREAGRWKHNVHRGAEAERVDLSPEYRRLAESVSETLGIDYLGVDLLVTESRVVVGETNARPTIDRAEKYDAGFYDALAGLIERTAERTER
ncbi:RimK family alpha-L-glutamate ligase [Salinigranum rubrum]|uniref:RimK family alpha-L-glutamate ligase n=1 Tax=Salinigranum rubrum TaxID=755307 RepID=A0A2I8VFA5_9EURY|nr:RimK family alpha-L-glutamate ligase [Salinigranum rubrum]AUV80612.1 RimK family alpha-L-glutamate ligase [Salinigranum rubrum]